MARPPLGPSAPEASGALPAADAGVVRLEGHRELTWTFANGPFGAVDVVVAIPRTVPEQAGARYPVLVAFHGRGESRKGRRDGARGWLDDYRLDRAMERLARPPLRAEDFEGYVAESRLGDLNRRLARHPYRGVIVVCPYLPDVLKGAAAFREAEPLAEFVVDVLLPRVRDKTPALRDPRATGIDGVSLGGRAALLVGAARPGAFGAVGGLQAALDPKEIALFASLLSKARADNPGLALRLTTSDEDYFEKENRSLSRSLRRLGVSHRFDSLVGTHSYRFNRGPGAIEMLLYHDAALRGSVEPAR